MAYQKTFLFLLILFPLANSIDTLSASQFLRDGDTLISSGQIFALGFFSPGKSKNRYVGIWYNRIPEKTVVWVANRENPVADFSGDLTISNGNLVLVDGGSHKLSWSTNVSTATNHSSATLTDSGNLVLRDDQDQRVLWESFDFPTHTFLQGMKIGLDRRTGLKRFLSSWKSPDDPAQGEFTLGTDTRGMPQFFLMKGADPIWRVGHWNGLRFTGAAGTDLDSLNSYTYVDDEDENYLTYGVNNGSLTSHFVMDISGAIHRLMWKDDSRRWILMWVGPGDSCDGYGHCGPNAGCYPTLVFGCACLKGFEPRTPSDWKLKVSSDGCMRRKALYCDGKGDRFLPMKNVKLPDTSRARVEPGLRLEGCEEECLKNCSCTAYATANISGEGSGCVMWYGDLIDIKVFPEDGQVLYTRLAASEVDENSGSFSRMKMEVIIVLAVTWVGIAFVTYGYFRWRTWKAKRTNDLPIQDKNFIAKLKFGHAAKKISNMVLTKSDLEETSDGSNLRLFDLSVINAATNHFSNATMLGKGGFGLVYKGKLLNGQEIAVKKLSENSRQGAEEFKNEVLLISKLQHKNLVRLLGYCISNQEKMLIYEFMRNKSLDTFIFDETRKVILDWRKRYNIIMGVARGVLYLHEDSRFKVIHRDLKVSNILLDDEMNPKISDFGMAKILTGGQTSAITSRVVGTYGYMSPEYAVHGLFSVKSDVFSFGVLLLEIISGKRNIFCQDSSSIHLIGHAWKLWKEGSILELVDSSMRDSCCQSEVLRCIQVGFLCVQKNAKDRPSMSSVVFMLGNEMPIPSPEQPAFSFQNNSDHHQDFNICSNNDLTITDVEAR